MSSRQAIIDDLVQHHDLSPQDIYLLPVLPLIEMIWADGRVQKAEVSLLAEFARKLLATLKQDAEQTVIAPAEAEAFIRRFLTERPDPRLLKHLRSLALESLAEGGPRAAELQREMLDYCLDIASAAVVEYPYDARERFNPEEKALLRDMLKEMQFS